MEIVGRAGGRHRPGCEPGRVAGPAAGAQGQKPPTFRSAVELIAVDVNVVDRNGQPVAGLAAEQFEVSVDGKPRRVASATFLDYAAAQADRPATAASRGASALRIEGSFSSNEVRGGGRRGNARPGGRPGD